jgi:hypothetical protein
VNNLPDLSHFPNQCQAQQHSCDDRLEDYLEHLVAPLIGIVPFGERKAFRQEACAHLEGLICEYMWQGKDRQKATETALREFGEPWEVGQAFLQEWLQGTPEQRPALLIRKATFTAFAWFGVASMLILLLLEQVIYEPSRDALLPGIGLLAFFAPFVAGALAGAMYPTQAGRGVRNAVWLLTVHAFATGLLLLPRYEVLAFAGWVLLFWLPAGWVSARVSASYLRQARRQRFWRIAR